MPASHLLTALLTALLATLQVTTPHFDHQVWVQSVASAASFTALQASLAQLEDALSHEGQAKEKQGKKTRGQAKAESERIPLLSPAWKVLSRTPCVKGAWLTCGAEVPAAVIGMEGLLQPVRLVQPAAAAATAAITAAEAGDTAAAGGGQQAVVKPEDEQQQQQDALQQQAAAAAQQRLQQQHDEALASLAWLPATAAALSLRLAALDAVLQYPQLGQHRGHLTGRECMARYR
jgi:hypothetical protein